MKKEKEQEKAERQTLHFFFKKKEARIKPSQRSGYLFSLCIVHFSQNLLHSILSFKNHFTKQRNETQGIKKDQMLTFIFI